MTNHHRRKAVFFPVIEPALAGLARTIAVLLVLTVIPGALMASEERGEGKRTGGAWITEAGFISGYGDASLDEGVYRTLLVIGHLGKEINHAIPALRGHRGTLSIFLEPQVNTVLKPAGEMEFGLGIGIQYAYPVTERISPYLLVVSGPHYISFDSPTQAKGFNFSSAIGAGIYLALRKDMALNLGYRHRHVSNADLKKPNEGIDSELGLLGLSFFF